MERSSIRLVQATPVPKLIWFPPVVQTGETRMLAPAPAVISFWKSHGSFHQSPSLLGIPLIQNSSLLPSLLMDNVPPPRIAIIWWLLGSLLLPLQLSCLSIFLISGHSCSVVCAALCVLLACPFISLGKSVFLASYVKNGSADSRCTYEILPYSLYRGSCTTTK